MADNAPHSGFRIIESFLSITLVRSLDATFGELVEGLFSLLSAFPPFNV
jgi:hypothetical protein